MFHARALKDVHLHKKTNKCTFLNLLSHVLFSSPTCFGHNTLVIRPPEDGHNADQNMFLKNINM